MRAGSMVGTLRSDRRSEPRTAYRPQALTRKMQSASDSPSSTSLMSWSWTSQKLPRCSLMTPQSSRQQMLGITTWTTQSARLGRTAITGSGFIQRNMTRTASPSTSRQTLTIRRSVRTGDYPDDYCTFQSCSIHAERRIDGNEPDRRTRLARSHSRRYRSADDLRTRGQSCSRTNRRSVRQRTRDAVTDRL